MKAVFAIEGLDETMIRDHREKHSKRKSRKRGFAENVAVAQTVQRSAAALHTAVDQQRPAGTKERRHGRQKSKGTSSRKRTDDATRQRGRQRQQ